MTSFWDAELHGLATTGSRFVEACGWVRSVLLNTRYILRVLHKLTRLVGVWADSDPDAQLRLPVRKCDLLKYNGRQHDGRRSRAVRGHKASARANHQHVRASHRRRSGRDVVASDMLYSILYAAVRSYRRDTLVR
jgi:hypothetical protein